MEYSLIEVAYAALLHDIGKFYQRTFKTSELTDEELMMTPYNKKGGYYHHLHSGYTTRFFKKYLNIYNTLEKASAAHHKEPEDRLSEIIVCADHLASAIDRKDEEYDKADNNKKGNFITTRLHSIFEEVDFGGTHEERIFPLSSFDDFKQPRSNYFVDNKYEASEEYNDLFEQFIKQIQNQSYLRQHVDWSSFHIMSNLLSRYCITIPASTYHNNSPTVSLYDHLKLSCAIASCLSDEECFETKTFYMIEIDVSGIQKFIYAILEGSDTKAGLTKSLRGRSTLVGIITNAISYAFLNSFGLTSANILFNTGGGSLILLPYNKDCEKKVHALSIELRKQLFSLFQTDITFVCAGIRLSAEELETFQSDKALELKERLGREKMHKFHDMISEDFFFEKIEKNNTCKLCGRVLNDTDEPKCIICKYTEKISNIYTKKSSFGIIYDFNNTKRDWKEHIDLGFVQIYFVDDIEPIDQERYVDAINDFEFGNRKMVSSSVPLSFDYDTLTFEEILKLQPKGYGDEKLAILKMDVDNLGGIFAFGLQSNKDEFKQRSISKYVTMSRLLEYFFGNNLMQICKDVSKEINPNIDSETINETLFYINYAGGDDLVIMGPVYATIQLANAIHKEFKNFTGNSDITISGGLQIQNDKQPIRFGVVEAEKQLEQSKLNGKNAMTLMDTTIPFGDFEKILLDVQTMKQYMQAGKISRTMLYNIMSFLRDDHYDGFVYKIPRIQYTLYRNIDHRHNEDVYQYFLNKLRSISDDRSLGIYVLKLKMLMLFTRNNEEERTNE